MSKGKEPGPIVNLFHAIALYGVLCTALERGTFYDNGRALVEELARIIKDQIDQCIRQLDTEPQG